MSDPQVLVTGLAFGESPRWHEDRLWVSDWGAGEVLAVSSAGDADVVARVRSFPMCIDFLGDGRLLVVSSSEGRLLRQEQDGSLVTHADLGPLGRHPWNDIVVDGRGNAYVNNTGFDFPSGQFAPGFVVVVTPDGSVRQVADDVWFPNGMAVTADNSTLIVAESYANRLTAFDIRADGSLAHRRVWADLGSGVPDGICLDAEGTAWYADVPNRCCVRVRQGGGVVQRIELDRGCFACVLGGAHRRTLFLVATEWTGTADLGDPSRTGQVLAVEVPVRGAGWP